MCGICGIYDLKGHPIDGELLKRMADIIKHRGPDGEGFYANANVGLGHRRLSIIDLEGGSQPISNENGTIYIIFNGGEYTILLKNWAGLIQKIYEVDPLTCPKCQGRMKVLSLVTLILLRKLFVPVPP